MKVCNVCGCIWDEEKQYERIHDVYCPECGEDDDIEDGERCVKCKDYFPKNTLLAGYCKGCGDAIDEAFREKISTFSPDEIAFLNEIYDGRWLSED